MTEHTPVTRPDLDALIGEMIGLAELLTGLANRATIRRAAAALATERARADQAADDAVRDFLDAIPERIVTVSGRGGLREFATTWKSAAPTTKP